MTTSAKITSTESVIRVDFEGELVYGSSSSVIPKRNIQGVTLTSHVNLLIYNDAAMSFSVEGGEAVVVSSINGAKFKEIGELFDALSSIV